MTTPLPSGDRFVTWWQFLATLLALVGGVAIVVSLALRVAR
jgi:hypothetical protein